MKTWKIGSGRKSGKLEVRKILGKYPQNWKYVKYVLRKYQENWKYGKYEKDEIGKYHENWKYGNSENMTDADRNKRERIARERQL